MKENKKETQLRSAEETLDRYSLEGTPLHIYKEEIVEIMEEYASQFKPSGVKKFTVEDMREACRKQRELCFDAFWDYSCNNIHDEDGFRDAIKGAKEPDFKDVVRQSVDIDDFLQSYYGAPKPTGTMECEYDNLFNLLTAFKKHLEGVGQKEASQFKPSGVKTGWISVEERLPEVEDGASEDVLCLGFKISPSREETATYEVMHWMKFDQPIEFKANGEPIEWGWSNKWWNNNVDYYHVFYWMPLPQSPE